MSWCPPPPPPLAQLRLMAFDGNADLGHRVGVFSTLTNGYALTAVGASENFYRYLGQSRRDRRTWVEERLIPAQRVRSRITRRGTNMSVYDCWDEDNRSNDSWVCTLHASVPSSSHH